jgi:hypothetical protein
MLKPSWQDATRSRNETTRGKRGSGSSKKQRSPYKSRLQKMSKAELRKLLAKEQDKHSYVQSFNLPQQLAYSLMTSKDEKKQALGWEMFSDTRKVRKSVYVQAKVQEQLDKLELEDPSDSEEQGQTAAGMELEAVQ